MKPSRVALGVPDYLLSALSCVTVLMSAGISVRNTNAGIVLSLICVLGHLAAAFGPRPKVSFHRITIDGVIFATIALVGIVFAGQLNRMLPEQGFPVQLLYTAGLCWVMALGSFVAWRDSTLLFLGVPAIALYGLVGAFDTFPLAPVMFFGFLVCTGTLFARSHLRNMLRLAEKAGEGDWDRLRGYAWKSLAGPEWALVSAVIVIAFSALGAPFIRESVQGATTPLRNPLRPATNVPNNPLPSNLGRPDPNRGSLRVGSGPYGRPSAEPVMTAVMSQPVYLRGEAFYRFQDNSWTTFDLGGLQLRRSAEPRSVSFSTVNPEFVELNGSGTPFRFNLSASAGQLPGPYLPGILFELNASTNGLIIRPDGILRVPRLRNFGPTASGVSYLPDRSKLKRAVKPGFWVDSLDQVQLSERVQLIVRNAINGAKDDYEKAELLRRMVSERIRYNLQAAQIPEGRDVVDTVLFETQEGYCDLYATALALTARSVGLPSRVASGYLVSADQESRPNEYVIRESDYHAWTEIYFEGAGWVTFDATEGTSEVEGFGRGEPWRDQPPWYETAWAQMAGNILIGVCVLGLVVALLWDIIRNALSRVRPTAPTIDAAKTAQQSSAVKAILDVERATGVPRRFPETVTEYFARAAREIPHAPAAPEELAPSINRMLYGEGQDPSQWEATMVTLKGWLAALKSARKSS